MNRLNLLLAVGVLTGSSLAVWPAGAAPTKKECIAAINSGEDLRQGGKLRAAKERFAVCVATSCPGVVREDCGKRLAEVVQATPTIVFEAKDGAGNDLSSVHVTIDGEPLTDKLDGGALPMDPGEHRFTFETDGVPKTEKTVVVREGDRDRHERVVLGAPPAPAVHDATQRREPSTSGNNGKRTLGFILGGVGLAGLAVGSGFGLWALAGSPCDSGTKTCATQADRDTLTLHENVSNVAFIVGLVGLGLGAYFLLAGASDANAHAAGTALRAASVSTWVGPGGVGLVGVFP